MIKNALRSRQLPVIAAICLIFAAAVVVQVQAFSSARDDLERANANRHTAEELSRAIDLIENDVWRSLASAQGLRANTKTAREGQALSDRARQFYAQRASRGDPRERRIARRVVRLTESEGALLGLLGSEASGEEFRALAGQVEQVSTLRTSATAQWLGENARIAAKAENRRRTRTWILAGLLLMGMLVLGITGVAMRLRVTRQRDRAMRDLRDTAAEMAALASTDPLTGLNNQREFHAVLAQQLAGIGESGSHSVALALIDVDNFKRVNDVHGHLVGDHVLIEIGRRLDAHVAPSRLHCARVGGEEFAVIMPRKDRAWSLRFAEQFRSAMEIPIVPAGLVTVSIGVSLATCEEGSGNIFRDADAALYAAKRAGKNRVVFADADLEPTRAGSDTDAESTFDALRALVSTVDNSQAISGHSERVAKFAARLARQAGWTPAQVARLRQAALLHDVGKVVVPPGILAKPGGLTDGERSLVSAHPAVGSEMVRRALDPDQAAWVLHHHERWDGGGYPDGLAGEEIPEGARILAIADAWDAMTSERVFAPALKVEDAIAELNACRGSQFWPHGIDLMVDATLAGTAEPSLAEL